MENEGKGKEEEERERPNLDQNVPTNNDDRDNSSSGLAAIQESVQPGSNSSDNQTKNTQLRRTETDPDGETSGSIDQSRRMRYTYEEKGKAIMVDADDNTKDLDSGGLDEGKGKDHGFLKSLVDDLRSMELSETEVLSCMLTVRLDDLNVARESVREIGREGDEEFARLGREIDEVYAGLDSINNNGKNQNQELHNEVKEVDVGSGEHDPGSLNVADENVGRMQELHKRVRELEIKLDEVLAHQARKIEELRVRFRRDGIDGGIRTKKIKGRAKKLMVVAVRKLRLLIQKAKIRQQNG